MPIPILSGPYKTFRPLNAYESFVEYEGSTITIPIRARRRGDDAWRKEEVKLSAHMRLEVFPAYVNGLGTREFQFIIRDWELHGTSALLNWLFFDDELGWLADDPLQGRLQAVLTFTVSHNVIKYGDADDTLLGPVDHLILDGLTSHHLRRKPPDDGRLVAGRQSNYLNWEITGDAAAGFRVVFHTKPVDAKGQIVPFDIKNDLPHLLGMSKPAAAGDQFVATLGEAGVATSRNMVRTPGNTVVSPLQSARRPLEIRWRLGSKPRAGRGRLRIVSPSRSLCTAEQRPDPGHPLDSADFPARLVYASNYHIFINQERMVEDQAGIAIAVGALEIPPRDVKVAFDKPHVGTVLEKHLAFDEGHCTGMHEITEAQFWDGMNYARYCRQKLPLVPDAMPPPYDPATVYTGFPP